MRKVRTWMTSIAAGIAIGYAIPQFFDRDVGGALASALLAIAGGIIGAIIAFVISRRNDRDRPARS
jgi:outer membrane lipoprotein SlyB